MKAYTLSQTIKPLFVKSPGRMELTDKFSGFLTAWHRQASTTKHDRDICIFSSLIFTFYGELKKGLSVTVFSIESKEGEVVALLLTGLFLFSQNTPHFFQL